VSRPTLREAFRILGAESLINVRRGARGGARVVAPDIAVAARYAGLLLQVTHTTIADMQAARVLREVVAMHLRTAAPRTAGRPGTREELRKTVRSYRKLVVLLDARNAEGAQHHWRAHLEAASRELLRGGLDPQAVVDLFG
jgi:GntR family transcriptional regulator, transcriptional repressor for pyruvate dehydrogenase complex